MTGRGNTVSTFSNNIGTQINNNFGQTKSVLDNLESWMNDLDQGDIYDKSEKAHGFNRGMRASLFSHFVP